MPLGSSGTSISFSQIQQEFGGTNPISASEYFRDGDSMSQTLLLVEQVH